MTCVEAAAHEDEGAQNGALKVPGRLGVKTQ